MSEDAFQNFISSFSPKQQKELKLATNIETTRVKTASRRLNNALGGGLGMGRVCLIYGNQSSGKSMLALQSIGKWQKEGLVCGYIDVEQTFDKTFAERLGVDTSRLIVDGSKSGARVTDTAVSWIEHGIDVIVIDSVSDIMPEAFVNPDGTVKDAENTKQIGAHAKAITAMTSSIHYANRNSLVILLSQTTTEIGTTYTKQIPHGGKKILFNSSQVIKLTSSNTDKNQIKGMHKDGNMLIEMNIGRSVDLLVEKNKLGPQHRTAKYDIYYGGESLGIDEVGELFDICLERGIIQGSTWYSYGEIKIQGRANFVDRIRESSELRQELESALDADSEN